MKYINKLFLVFTTSMLFFSCAELDRTAAFLPKKPTDVAEREYLNSFDILKAYIDRSTNPGFKLGMGVTSTDFIAKETVFSLALTNFDQISTHNEINHASIVEEDGSMNFTPLQTLVLTAEESTLDLYGDALCWHANQNNSYLNELIADIVIHGATTSGIDVVVDFESYDSGDTFPMTNGSTATVEEDPKGVSGKVLHVGNEETPANGSYPKIPILLKEGRTLGEYSKVIIDFNGTGSTGLYGWGIRMYINDNPETVYGSPSSYGCPDGDWGRGAITLEIENLNLTDQEKELTEFTLIIGSGTEAGDYYIDNISFYWEHHTPPGGDSKDPGRKRRDTL